MNTQELSSPKPFLSIPLSKKSSKLEISQGWEYSEDERIIHPHIPRHFAVDFEAPWGKPAYAAAGGYAQASYHLFDTTDSKGATIGFGLGLFTVIWHEEAGVYSLYAHLSGINNQLVPYLPPTEEKGGWQPRQALYVSIETFKKNAKPVQKGDLIGYIGYTGLRKDYVEIPANPPTIDPAKNKTWDPHGAHLHWEIFTRTADGSKKDKRYDPFGIYDERSKYSGVFKKACGLILATADGSPEFAHP